MDTELDLTREGLEAENYAEDANKGTRFLNYIIDVVFFYIASLLVGLAIGAVVLMINPSSALFDEYDTPGENLIFQLISLVVYILYYTFFEYFNNGKTIAKIITKTRVVHEDASKSLDISTILGRSAARIVPFEAFSFLGSGDRGWHDRWSKTRVVKDR
ncbi:MAG: RDD family protein [Saprospiraceae bacterium]|nr:RDD family protein [Saprospiraceae bacterium]